MAREFLVEMVVSATDEDGAYEVASAVQRDIDFEGYAVKVKVDDLYEI